MEAVVLFEYEKQQDDELSLKVGEVILDVKQADEGWCEGTLNGARGMFPDNFVQVRPASSSKPPAPAPEAVPSPIPSEQHNADIGGSSVLRVSKKARRAKVTYSYVAENPDELNLQPGQVVDIVEEEEEGWWKGRVDGKEGLFPSNFVEMMEQNSSTTSSDTLHDYSVPPPLEKPLTPLKGDAASYVIVPQPRANPAPAVDHSMPRDRPEEAPPPRQSVLGPKLFPAFNPVEARSKLKATTPAKPPPAHTQQPPSTADRRLSVGTPKKPAPPTVASSRGAKAPALPPSAPPEKPPIKPPEKQVERAKVLFNYTAEQPDELSIKVGDVLEVVSKDIQEGWWEVRQGDQTGLIPDNFVELLPPQPAQPQQPPKPKPHVPSTEKTEPPPQPPAKAAALPPTGKKPPAKPATPHPPKSTEPSPPHATEESDFGVPTTTPLDTSALKNRPRNPVSRPPSRSNLQQAQEPEKTPEEPPDDSNKLPPWQKELKARKAKVPVPPSKPAAAKPPPATRPPPAAVKPPSNEPESKPKPAPAPSKPPAAKPTGSKPTPPPSTPNEIEPVGDSAWKEAFDKLKTELDRFRKEVRREIQILTDDLDKERKIRAELQIDIDRLKKSREFRDNL